MQQPRLVDWNEPTLPFGNPPTRGGHLPDAEALRRDVRDGRMWIWNYNGLMGALTLETMRHALQVWDDFQAYYTRSAVPAHVGVFTWGQTVPPIVAAMGAVGVALDAYGRDLVLTPEGERILKAAEGLDAACLPLNNEEEAE